MGISDVIWRKSSYSGSGGGSCVEVAQVPDPAVVVRDFWRKSSYSGSSGGNCVEVAQVPAPAIAVRDSKDPDGPRLVFTADEWRAFVAGAKAGEFDLR
jgi:hypothetical protein